MTSATWTTARWHACPDGHDDPKTGGPARAVIPDGTGLIPRCTACRQPMALADGALTGTWRLDECCVPADPGGRWYGPPRDPAVCSRCYGTQRVAICTTCLLPGCPGTHAGACRACDGEGNVPCETCDGEGHIFDQSGEDKGLCPNPDCVAGIVPCQECHFQPFALKQPNDRGSNAGTASPTQANRRLCPGLPRTLSGRFGDRGPSAAPFDADGPR